jgi:hypothetical protein
MEYLAYALAALLFLYALGLGFTLLVLPAEFRQYSLVVAPWVGYCYGTLTFWEVYEFGGRVSSHTAQLVLLPPLLCLAGVLFTKGFTRTLRAILDSRKVMGSLAIAGAVFVFLSIPLLRYTNGLTTVSLFNYDVANYATVSRFLTEFTRTSSVGFVGQGIQSFNQFTVDGYFGPASSAAFLGVYLGVMPDQDTTLCINLFGALGSANLFLFLSDTLKVRAKFAFLGAVLFGFHPAFQYLALQGFFAQIVATGLAVLIIWVNATLIEAAGRTRYLARYFILLACFTSGLLLTYQHMLPFVWIFAGVYSVVLALHKRTARPIWISVIGHLAAFAVAAALSPARAIAFLPFFKRIAGLPAGWPMPFFTPDYLAGVSYQNSPFMIEDPQLHLIAAIAVGAIAFFWLLIAFRNARETTVAVWIGCAVIYTGTIILGLHGENGQIGGYKSFKFATFFLPFFAAAAACLFDTVPRAWSRLSLALKILVLISLSFGYCQADARLLEAMRAKGQWVQPQYRDLLSVDDDNRVQSVNILGPNGWENMWATYFLMHKEAYCEGPAYWVAANLYGTYDLMDNQVNAPIRHLPSARIPVIRRLNDRFYLIGPFPKQ